MSTIQEPMTNSFNTTEYAVDEFQYRPVPILVSVSMGFAFLSLLAGLSDLLLVVPLIGMVLGFVAYYQISRSQGDLSGGLMAVASIVLMLVMFVGFGSMHLYSYATEVPAGYTRYSFASDISKKGFQTIGQQKGIHPDVAKLNDQEVYLKGYMYPTRDVHGLRSFVLCKDMGECCFGGQPQPTDMILVNMTDDQAVDFQEKRLIGVAGKFRVAPVYDADSAAGLRPIYQLDCKIFAPAKTWY